MSEDRRKKHGNDITLYDWAKICNCPKSNTCGTDHVPVFTGFPNIYCWPVEEEFARANLMMFANGSWVKPDDLLTLDGVTHANYTSAFATFIDTPQCPNALKEMLIWAKQTYDNKRSNDIPNFDDLNMPDASQMFFFSIVFRLFSIITK